MKIMKGNTPLDTVTKVDVVNSPFVSKDVDFIDYDGTLLYSYTLEDIQKMNELPPLPERDGLICQGWNWNLEDIKAHNRRLIVGATYITDDGKTRIYIDLTSEDRLEMSLYFSQTVKNGVEVDWGDGSPVETFDKSSAYTYIFPTHKYKNVGKFVITFNSMDGCILRFGASNYNNNITGSNYVNNKYARQHYSNAIYKVNIGKNVSLDNNFQFDDCRNLREATIPNSITKIGSSLFNECYSLSCVIFPSSMTEFGQNLFNYDYSLKVVSIPNGISAMPGSIFQDCYNLDEVILPDSVIDLSKSNVFAGCYNLKEIIIPKNVTSLAYQLFAGCYSLKEIVIPYGVTSIGNSAFSNDHHLKKIIIPDSVTSMGSQVFSSNKTLREVIIPDSVTEIGSTTFGYCDSLIKVKLSKNITTIPQSMFVQCYSLPEIEIPENVMSIGNSAFNSCYSLLEIIIPNKVINIAASAFNSCYSIKKYDFSKHIQVPTLENTNAFSSIQSDCQIIVPDALYDEWIAATNWSYYADRIVKVSEVKA